jgi:hypothetical protein
MSKWSKKDFRAALVTLLVAGSIFLATPGKGQTGSSEGNKAERTREIILQVLNNYFTRGTTISSLYLRVFSDGTAECHTEKFTGEEKDVTKRKILGAKGFEELKAVINGPNFPEIKKRYELNYPVVDSWMEWLITVQHPNGEQSIQVANFSPASELYKNQAYPDALVKLGCSILKIREEVFDDPYAYSKIKCPHEPSEH